MICMRREERVQMMPDKPVGNIFAPTYLPTYHFLAYLEQIHFGFREKMVSPQIIGGGSVVFVRRR